MEESSTVGFLPGEVESRRLYAEFEEEEARRLDKEAEQFRRLEAEEEARRLDTEAVQNKQHEADEKAHLLDADAAEHWALPLKEEAVQVREPRRLNLYNAYEGVQRERQRQLQRHPQSTERASDSEWYAFCEAKNREMEEEEEWYDYCEARDREMDDEEEWDVYWKAKERLEDEEWNAYCEARNREMEEEERLHRQQEEEEERYAWALFTEYERENGVRASIRASIRAAGRAAARDAAKVANVASKQERYARGCIAVEAAVAARARAVRAVAAPNAAEEIHSYRSQVLWLLNLDQFIGGLPVVMQQSLRNLILGVRRFKNMKAVTHVDPFVLEEALKNGINPMEEQRTVRYLIEPLLQESEQESHSWLDYDPGFPDWCEICYQYDCECY
jgi:hypothetical protein